MHRRDFLTSLLAAPALLLPKRTIFLPPVGGWPPSVLSTVDGLLPLSNNVGADLAGEPLYFTDATQTYQPDLVIHRRDAYAQLATHLDHIARECARSQGTLKWVQV